MLMTPKVRPSIQFSHQIQFLIHDLHLISTGMSGRYVHETVARQAHILCTKLFLWVFLHGVQVFWKHRLKPAPFSEPVISFISNILKLYTK